MTVPVTVQVTRESDIASAGRAARQMTAALGFARTDAETVVLAVLELATNLVRYARNGRIVFQPVAEGHSTGIQIESHDDGPGIADIARAMQDGYSTGGSLGSGLPGARRLLDEFAITSGPDGTHITARKWLIRP